MEGNSLLLGRPVLCQVVVENKADWTFAPLSGYRILWLLAPPTVFADRWQSGGDSEASISRHMAMPAYRPGGGSRSSTTCQRCRGRRC